MDSPSVYSSVSWRLLERFSSQGIGLIIQIAIARVIAPNYFGEFAILMSVINIFSVVVQSGFSTYIVQVKRCGNVLISTLLTAGLLLSILCFVLVLLFGLIALPVLNAQHLFHYLIVLALILPINMITGVFSGLLMRNMCFKEMFFRAIVALPLAAVVCFAFVMMNQSLWALVSYNISNSLFTLLLYVRAASSQGLAIRPSLDSQILRDAIPFSMRLLLQDIGNTLSNSIRSMLLGAVHGSAALAYYDRAFTYTGYVEESATYSVQGVLLPVMSRKHNSSDGQDILPKMGDYIEKAMRAYGLMVTPLLCCFFSVAPAFVDVVLTDKWLPIVPYIRIFVIGFMYYPFFAVQKPAFLACGRSDITLKLTLLQNITSIILLVISIQFGPILVAVAASIAYLVNIPLYSVATNSIFELSIKRQLNAFIYYLLLSIPPAAITYIMNWLELNSLLLLCMQLLVFFSIYIVFLIIKRDSIATSIFLSAINRIKKVMN